MDTVCCCASVHGSVKLQLHTHKAEQPQTFKVLKGNEIGINFQKHVLSLPECIAVANKAKIWLLLVKMNSGVKKELRRAAWHLQQ